MRNIAKEIVFETSSQVLDAIAILSAAHKELIHLFDEYERAQSITDKRKIVEKISTILIINMQIEEEIVHPAVKMVLKEKGVISAITMNHSILKYLVSEIKSIDADSDIYDVKVRVLGEHVRQYFKEKENRLFPKAHASRIVDLWALGTQLTSRKQELLDKCIGVMPE